MSEKELEEKAVQDETINTIAKHVKAMRAWWPFIIGACTLIAFIVGLTAKFTTAYDNIPKKDEVASKQDMVAIKTALDTVIARQKANNKKLNLYITQTSIQTNKFRDSINHVVTFNKNEEDRTIGAILGRLSGVTETHKIKNGKAVETVVHPVNN